MYQADMGSAGSEVYDGTLSSSRQWTAIGIAYKAAAAAAGKPWNYYAQA